MRYAVDIPTEDIPVANSPEIGGESRVKLSYDEIGTVGEISQTAPGSGSLTENIPAYDFPVGGVDLQLVALTGIKSSAQVVVDINVTLQDDTSAVARATFVVPSYAQDQTQNLPIGLAVDFIPQGVGNASKKIKAVIDLDAITGGQKGNRFSIVSLPAEDAWHQLNCPVDKSDTPDVPASLPIPCGLKSTAFTKAGRPEPATLGLSAKHFTFGDGLARLSGHRGSVMVETYKEGRVLSERTVYGGYRPKPTLSRGDGNDEVMFESEGNYEFRAIFV